MSASYGGFANLDESVNLLAEVQVESNPASPFLSTVRMFLPAMVVTPTGDMSGAWSFSKAASDMVARQTVRASLAQQASLGAQVRPRG